MMRLVIRFFNCPRHALQCARQDFEFPTLANLGGLAEISLEEHKRVRDGLPPSRPDGEPRALKVA